MLAKPLLILESPVSVQSWINNDSPAQRHANAFTGWPIVARFHIFLRLKIERNGWLLADMCPQAANHCALF